MESKIDNSVIIRLYRIGSLFMGMKKSLKIGLVITLVLTLFPVLKIEAEDDYSDTTYWTNLCTSGSLSSSEQSSCQAFLEYMSAQSDSLESTISSIDSQREDIAANIEEYVQLIGDYQAEIDDLTVQINTLQTQIEEQQAQIDAQQAEVDDLRSKVKTQIANAQGTMRISKMIDVLMGVKTIVDFIRIANGLSDITEYNNRNLIQLNLLIQQLEAAKAALIVSQEECTAKQEEVLAKQYEAQIIEEEYEKQSAELMAQRASLVSNIDEIQATMESITEALGQVTASPGWTWPVPGVKMTPGAGTWYYSSGGKHYGEDFGYGVVYGSSYVVAAANGVVLNANDAGCGYGHLGDYCPVVGGGNEILLLVIVNGSTYGVKYYHLMTGSFSVSTGQVVNAGDRLALVGSSGNSTGPHCHICVYYLGDASIFASYAQSWNGDMAMNTGWNSSSERICENGASAPCKVRPETIFGTGWE